MKRILSKITSEMWLAILVWLGTFIWSYSKTYTELSDIKSSFQIQYENEQYARKTADETEIKFRELNDNTLKEDITEIKAILRKILGEVKNNSRR